MRESKKIQKLIKSNGGKAVNSVTHEVTHLVASDEAIEQQTTKVKKAKELGVLVVSEDYLRSKIGEKGGTSKKDSRPCKILSHSVFNDADEMDDLEHWKVQQILNTEKSWKSVEFMFDTDENSESLYHGLHYGTVEDRNCNKYQIVYYDEGGNYYGAVFYNKEKHPAWHISDFQVYEEDSHIQDIVTYFIENTMNLNE